MQPPRAQPIYQFGDFELDTRRRVLVSRADGQPVDITGRVIEALIHLVERAGQLVEKKTLIEALWPHVVVEEGSLTQTIHTLRRVLGEKSGDHRYIATVPGRGYRFVAEVTLRGAPATVEPAPAQPVPADATRIEASPPRRPKWIPAALASAVASMIVIGLLAWRQRDLPVASPTVRAQASIAVLPFVDMSAEQDQVHFAEGLSEEILNILVRADDLRVIARTSSFSFRGQSVDIRTIAQRLSVSHVLEGSVRKSGERVRITAQLIDAATSAHLWSDTFDRDLDDIFGVQREIATAVADALHVKLRSAAPTRAETRSTQAYEHYLQGRHLFNRRSGDDLAQARSHLEKAVTIDPDYGRAWSALAGVYSAARFEKVEFPNAMEKWRQAAERGVALAPDLAEAQMRAAQYQWHTGNSSAAYAHVERATELDPQEPLLLGLKLTRAISEGRMEDAIAHQRRVIAGDPLSAINRTNLGFFLTMVGRLPEARAELERALELSPASPVTISGIANVLILQRRWDEALKVLSQLPDGYVRDEGLALVQFARGEVAESDAMLARLLTSAENPDTEPGETVAVAVAIAEIYAMRNDPDRAFAWLERAHSRSGSNPQRMHGWLMHENLHVTPFLKPLHADPRWDALLESIAK